MHSLKKLSFSFSRILRNNIRRTLTSQPAANVNVDKDKEKTILVKQMNKITTIGINRPEKRNCLDVATAHLLSETLDEFENNEESLVGVLYGVGGNFCAGYDLKEIADYDGENEESIPHFGPLANRTELSKKPLIVALNGYAVGIGFELALMCDLRVVEETAMVGFLNRRFGIPISCGGTVRLPAMIGYSRAMDLILTGRLATAQEIFNWGIAHSYTSCGAALGRAMTLANSLVKFPQKSLLADRASAYFATFSPKQIEESLQFEKDNSSHLILEEGVPGAKKFVDRGIGRHGKFHNITKQDKSIRELDENLL
ncbi:PREDICTED: carnitinyl-CoA dehydratase-like [Trachymyrmex cornetzi]|uniref:carnitinyl-CoA dehydratase-like n=1 Tax=Trachymyrmex cornetzi TaxID=471704 RepID=UPI00084F6D34|nr:PREDICTED: carnitinyl-CoA dehydratase-like [Trachymyrmex cornetzi]